MKNRREAKALVVALVAIPLVALGCGRQKSETRAEGPAAVEETRAAAVESRPAAVLAEATQKGETVDGGVLEGLSGLPAISQDSLPPEVAASTVETPVPAGTIIEVTAEGSSDVTGMNLTDGVGKTQPMTYDSATDLWRALYRVPLRTSTDRIGLAVTAKNGANRWRRVWVFLDVQRKGAQTDSISAN